MSISIYAIRGSTCYKITMAKGTTVRQFTRVLQHNCTFGIAKSNMRLWSSATGKEGTWEKYYSFRFQNEREDRIYDEPLTLELSDGMWIGVELVMSSWNIVLLAGGMVLAAPVAAVTAITGAGFAAATAAGAGGSYLAGYAVGFVATKVALTVAEQTAVRYVRKAIPRELPTQILEIQEVKVIA